MLKLQSGVAGELEPLRRIGFDLSQARLQQEAYTLGITKKISAMTQAEKAELRYHAILSQVTIAQGDMARTLNAPANQLRILKAQVIQAGRAIGNIFIPALNAILPYAIAVVKVLRLVAERIAKLFGFELPKVDYSGLQGMASGADNLSNALDGVGDSAKDSAEKIKKLIRDKGYRPGDCIDENDREDIALELGDVMWYVAELASNLDLSLETICQLNIIKLSSRKSRNKLHGSGDFR